MNPEEVKALLKEQGEAWKAYRDTNDARIAALEAGKGTAEFDTKLARIEEDVNKYSKALERIGDVENTLNKLSLGGGSNGNPSKSEILVAFEKWASCGGDKEFRAAINTQSGPDGGFVVIPEFETMLDNVAKKAVAMRSLASIKKLTRSDSFEEFIGQGGAAGGWVGETDTRGETNTPTLEKVETFVREQYANPKMSLKAIEDASVDLVTWLAEEIGAILTELEGEAFITGAGNKSPSGILSYTKVANASYAWGKVGYIASGKSAAFADSDPADKLIDLIHALKSKYRTNASWMMNDLTLAAIRKLKSTTGTGALNQYLWEPSAQAGVPSKLLGYPLVSEDYMPDIAADSYSLAFGDFKAGYRIVDKSGIKILQDPYTSKGNVFFYTTKRVGGGIRNFEAIKLMKMAAS
jgi:HK97 family phage major capsid protein